MRNKYIIMEINYRCRVCGLKQSDKPWGDDNKTPTFEICDCCGVEFGYEDSTPQGINNYRQKWIETGAKWMNPNEKPDDWNLEVQLAEIGVYLDQSERK